MSLNDFRKNQYQHTPNLPETQEQAYTNIFLVLLAKVIQYLVLILIGCVCWNYLAPLFNLPMMSFLKMLALIILSEILFLRGTRK